MKDEEKIPHFVQNYLSKMDHEGYADFVKLSREYHKQRHEYPGKFATQSHHLNDFNRATGQNRQLNYEDGLKRIETDYKKKAYQTAKQHGFTGSDPNQPSDRAFTKQGEKFQGMMDNAKERRQEKMQQSEQNLKDTQAQEKKNINALREQQPYQQSQPKVEFKGVEKKQPSGGGQQSQEQQRAAFLQKINQTKQSQAQRQQGTQPEI